jgi:hypothetical protein
MQIRQIQQDDLERLMGWLVDQPWPLPPVQNGMSQWGFVVSDEEGDVAFSYVYLTETGYVFLDWIGLNPDRPFEDHKIACLAMVDKIEGMLKVINAAPKPACLVLYTRIQWLADALKQQDWRSSRHFIQCTKLMR